MQGPCYSSNRLISCVFYSSLYGFPGEAFIDSTNPTCNPFNTLSHVPVGQQTVLHLRPRHCLCHLHVSLPPRGKHSCSSLAYPTVVWVGPPLRCLLLAFVIYCYILLRFATSCFSCYVCCVLLCLVTSYMERGSSVVECRTRSQVSPGSNPSLLPFRRLGIFVLSIDSAV